MNILQRLLARETAGVDALRLMVCATVLAHGADRLISGNPALGLFLSSLGLPFGPVLATLISSFEVAGAVALALRWRVAPLCIAFGALYLAGILLFHRHIGFFVIGPNDNGWELSMLLCASLYAIGMAATGRSDMTVLRVTLCGAIFMHGWYRQLSGHSDVLGGIMTSKGFPFGLQMIEGVNLVETLGAVLIACRLLVAPLTLLLSMFYAVGIVWFHWRHGFFVVAPGDFKWEPEGWGWEYSALLITCLLTTAWDNRADPFGFARLRALFKRATPATV